MKKENKSIAGKTRPLPRGLIKLKPTQVHKTKRAYNRKKTKVELKNFTKTP